MASDLCLPSVFPNGVILFFFPDQKSEIVYPFLEYNLIYKVKKVNI